MFEIIPIAELIQDAFNASLYEAEEYLSGILYVWIQL